jgi:hypothetical protein
MMAAANTYLGMVLPDIGCVYTLIQRVRRVKRPGLDWNQNERNIFKLGSYEPNILVKQVSNS